MHPRARRQKHARLSPTLKKARLNRARLDIFRAGVRENAPCWAETRRCLDIFRAGVRENAPCWAEIWRCLDIFRAGVRERPPHLREIWRCLDNFRGRLAQAAPVDRRNSANPGYLSRTRASRFTNPGRPS